MNGNDSPRPSTPVISLDAVSQTIEFLLTKAGRNEVQHHGSHDEACQWCKGYREAFQEIRDAIEVAVKEVEKGTNGDGSRVVGTVWRFKAMPGKDGGVITHLPDGRVGFFDRYDKMTAKIRPGDLVQGRIIEIKPRCGIVLPLERVGDFQYLLDDGMPLPPTSTLNADRAPSIDDDLFEKPGKDMPSSFQLE